MHFPEYFPGEVFPNHGDKIGTHLLRLGTYDHLPRNKRVLSHFVLSIDELAAFRFPTPTNKVFAARKHQVLNGLPLRKNAFRQPCLHIIALLESKHVLDIDQNS